jgi:hypothetical protein
MRAVEDRDLTVVEAAVHLGMSPTSFAELLDRGVLPMSPGRRIALSALEAHRDERFAVRQQLAQQARARRRPSYGPDADTADVVIVEP